MTTGKICVGVIGFLLAFGTATAAVYKSVDAQGNVVYTDDPEGNGDPVKLPPLSTVPPRKYTPATTSSPDAAETAPLYQQLEITAPTPDATLRDNTGNVTVSVALQPDLNTTAGHRLQYMLDGQPQGKPSDSSQAQFPNVPRGTHTVEVAVVDASGHELKRSTGIRFHLHRQSIHFPRGP